MKELVSQRCTKDQITMNKIRTILKSLRLRKAYDHVAQIYTKITGYHCPRITTNVEEQCRKMFTQMQPAFEKYCPKTRKNFLSYNYVLFRCFHILGVHHMLQGFALLKGREKLLLQDEIFEKIAEEMGWTFVPIDDVFRIMSRDSS